MTAPHDVPEPSAAAAERRAPSTRPLAALGLSSEGLHPVSAKLIGVRLLGQLPLHVITLLMVAGAVALWLWLGWWWPALIALGMLILSISQALLTPRRVRAIGYRDREDDLVVASGLMFRSVTVVPFGRVQSVDIGQGPLERTRGLAHLSVTTAAAGGGVTIPGLPKAEAERLRSLLTERGVELMAAL